MSAGPRRVRAKWNSREKRAGSKFWSMTTRLRRIILFK